MRARRSHFVLLCGATLFHFLAIGIMLAALPLFVRNELGQSRAMVGFAVGSFSISAVLLRPLVGRSLDRRGRKLFLVGGPILLLASAAGLLVTRTLIAVIVLRLVQGASGAAFYTAAAAVAVDLAGPARRAALISRFSLFLYAGLAVGPAIGEHLARNVGFSAAWATAAACAAIAAAVARSVAETIPPTPDGARDVVVRRLWHPAAVGPGAVLLTAAVGYTAITIFSPLYAPRIGMRAGALYVAFAVTIIGVRLISGTLADRFGRVAVAFPGLLASAGGLALLATVPRPAAAIAGVAAFGAGFGMVFPSLMALAVDRVPDHERGEALGSFTAFFDLGAAGGGWLVGSIADAGGFRLAWGFPAALCAIGAVGLLRLASAGSWPVASLATKGAEP